MSEELRDASKTLPRSMLWTTLVNGSMGFVILITFCSVLGSIEDALASPTKQAYMYVFYNSTQSVAGASAMSALVIFMAIFCNLSITATSSRQLFAFARDQGVPFSSTFAYNIASLSTAAILASYIVSISCITLKRIRGEPLLPSKFDIGRAGLPINIASIVFLVFVFIFSFMPMGPKPNAAGMNWSILMFGSTVVLSIAYYFVKGRHVYAGPVTYVRKGV
ncbi:hypothetical protein N0V91_006532 [Didymella pomorum]|uniref:Amino acid transporter n=1 Tax=Didymella pomorum TaxID=749634 RepID=A0A9W8ZCT1_9PLEO|nr:hypothetical protein N0V91_006532 [Didymella pomorum]